MVASALVPLDEEARLAALHRYEVLDTPPEPTLDRIAALAARVLGTPAALVTLVDADRVWVKARYGMPGVTQTAREEGLCASVVLGAEPYVVQDARTDPRTCAHPLVTGPPGLRFYAAVPLATREGHRIGTLCVADTEARTITPDEIRQLRDLADLVVDQLELRRQTRDAVRVEEALRRDAERLADALQASFLPPTPPTVPGMEIASRFVAGERGLQVGGDFLDVFRVGDNDWALVLGDVCGKGARAAAVAGLARWTLRASALHAFSPSEVLADLNAALLAHGDGDDHFCTAAFGRLELDVCGAWVTLAVSGHPQPVLVRASGLVERRGLPSLPVGMFDEIDPVDDRVGLGPGDCLVFYTDGIIEARSAEGDLFGSGRLVALLTTLIGGKAQEIADTVVEQARRFSADGLSDDAAVLVVLVPESARGAGPERVADAIGVPVEELALPDYPHGGGPPSR